MTTLQLNAELYRAMGEIADNEKLLAKVLAYVKGLVSSRCFVNRTRGQELLNCSPKMRIGNGSLSGLPFLFVFDLRS